MTALNLVHVTQAVSEGVGVHVASLATSLAEGGHRVEVIYSPKEPDAQFKEFLRKAPCDGVRVTPIEMTRNPGARDTIAYRELHAALRRTSPVDVIHAHSSKAGALVRLVAAGGSAPVVYSPHGMAAMDSGLSRLNVSIARSIERLLSPLADCIVAVSEYEAQFLRSLGLRCGSLATISLGLDAPTMLPRSEAREILDLDEGELVIGFVGRFASAKAPEIAVEAFARADLPGSKLVMIGDGPQKSRVEAAIGTFAAPGSVVLTGRRPARPLLSAFDAVLVSSRYESFGYVTAEALLADIPVLSSPVGIGPTLAALEGAPIVITRGDARSLAEGLTRVVERRTGGARPSAGSVAIRSALSVQAMTGKHIELYRALSGKHRKTLHAR